MDKSTLQIAYFGGEPIGVPVLRELENAGLVPSLVVCNPNRPTGRKQELMAPPVKQWADERSITVFQPESLSDKNSLEEITSREWDLFIVVAYGLILPKWFIELPKFGTLNMHPSLLPLLRGASPIRTAILEDMKETGVTVMQMDEKMDHGPIVAQEAVTFTAQQWPMQGHLLDETLGHLGGALLAQVIPKWVAGKLSTTEQDHGSATFTKKITKKMGEMNIDPLHLPSGKDVYDIYLKICAFDEWPGTFFFYNGKRIKITDASLSSDEIPKLMIHKVIPEGKKEIDFAVFLLSI